MHPKVKYLLIDYFELNPSTSENVRRLLIELIASDNLVISVHAYRALVKSKYKFDPDKIVKSVNSENIQEWIKNKYFLNVENISNPLSTRLEKAIRKYLIANIIQSLLNNNYRIIV